MDRNKGGKEEIKRMVKGRMRSNRMKNEKTVYHSETEIRVEI